MKIFMPSLSVIFGILAVMLLVVPTFKTPPLPITIFAVLGVLFGLIGVKENKMTASIGIIISVVSFLYLVYLFSLEVKMSLSCENSQTERLHLL